MKEICVRRRVTLRAFALCAGLAMLPAGSFALAQSTPMKIGIIGSGNIGGTLGVFWAKAGHEVLFSSRHPEELVDLVKRAGPSARAGMPREAAAFGDVVLISIPYGAVPQVGRDLAADLAGQGRVGNGQSVSVARWRDGRACIEEGYRACVERISSRRAPGARVQFHTRGQSRERCQPGRETAWQCRWLG